MYSYKFVCNITRISFFIFLYNGFLTGCATKLEFDPIIIRSDTPEVSGKLFNGDLNSQIGYAGSRVYAELYQEVGGDYADSSEAYIRNSLTYALNGKLGITRYLDVYLRGSFEAPGTIGAKVQLLGNPSRKSLGLKTAIAAEFGSISGPDNKDSNKKLSVDMYDVSFMLGYRLDPQLIIYTNNFYSNYNIDGSISRGIPEYSVKGKSTGYGGLIGAKFNLPRKESNGTTYIQFEIGFVNLNWLPTREVTNGGSYTYHNLSNNIFGMGFITGKTWQ